ncbi:MAG: 4-hydroxy-tetrahydrodipicolinate reductase [Solirubrobacteraceae bacterium]
MIAVGVAGAAGRMGLAVCEAVGAAEDLELVGRADPALDRSVQELLEQDRPDVLVDFTTPGSALGNAVASLREGVHVVIGTTGLDLDALRQACGQGSGGAKALVAPNFAIGAVLMMRFAAEAAKHMDAAEIVELHHDRKLDAPSGTAALTAQLIAEQTGGPPPPIHSVRLPGLLAHQEVILGALGQTLTIRHDSLDRGCFMPGVLLAVRRVGELPDSPTIGLERLLFGSSGAA